MPPFSWIEQPGQRQTGRVFSLHLIPSAQNFSTHRQIDYGWSALVNSQQAAIQIAFAFSYPLEDESAHS
jgi:hypothetical protein